MDPSIIPLPMYPSIECIKLGRFVTNMEHPHENYYDAKPLQPKVIQAGFSYTSETKQTTNADFRVSVLNTISTSLSKQVHKKLQIKPVQGTTYCIDNSEEWFHQAILNPKAKQWLERCGLDGKRMYLIVGYQTFLDPCLIQESGGQGNYGSEIDPVKALSTAVAGPLASASASTLVTIHGERNGEHWSAARLSASGERVSSIQYRTITYQWFSRRTLENLYLSKTHTWSCLEGRTRAFHEDEDDEEDEEDIFGVQLDDNCKTKMFLR
ncbi:hypothetical protein VHEMI04685 [[Torrubiella] hemipterigena]|uniref:Uncharacterized protein n=1 Tax=[Torrubiella] hemipterigena TaxID=1531966 RepID=A0A0A1T1Y1_9HYPO|nr:hypothetical protein VHEMI04685 [[Torrubiella] hemipterigena]